MKTWSVDKIVGVGLVATLVISVIGGIMEGTSDAWTLGKDIVIGLLGYMKGIEHKEEQKNG